MKLRHLKHPRTSAKLRMAGSSSSNICSEERRRCKIWGDVVQKGGSYDEADAAALRGMPKLLLDTARAPAPPRKLLQKRVAQLAVSRGDSAADLAQVRHCCCVTSVTSVAVHLCDHVP